MSVVTWKMDEGVATVLMNNEQNLQNLDFARDMNHALDAAEADPQTRALVLTSSDEKFFSNGIDVAWLTERFAAEEYQAVRDFCYGMDAVFKKLLLAPFPAIAAINGHAFGNGAILACACDFRFMKSDRGFFCFPEVDLGIPFLPGMDAFIEKAIPRYKLNELKLTGKRATAPELEAAHVIEKACGNAEHLMAETMAFAGFFNKKRGIFAEHKRRMYQRIIDIIDTQNPEHIDSLNLMIRE
ncbi:MAG: enoyl-CoA hydratase/isomerase family protein [Desulfobacterales bacterium]|nr:enoyl-CoA hydratase/isomerase family protein [Desulfobacterales bacterium]